MVGLFLSLYKALVLVIDFLFCRICNSNEISLLVEFLVVIGQNNLVLCQLFYFWANGVKGCTLLSSSVDLSCHDIVCNWALE